MNETETDQTGGSRADRLVYFSRPDGLRIPFKLYGSPEIYQLGQERIFRGGSGASSRWKVIQNGSSKRALEDQSCASVDAV
jgi:hypothetical protein